jgi:hypothetical protein
MSLTPGEKAALREYFAGGGRATGEKSPFGAQLERARLGLGREPSSPDLGDRQGQETVDWLKVDRRLRSCRPETRRVLAAVYSPPDVRGKDPDWKKGDAPPDHGHLHAELADYGELGPAMALCPLAPRGRTELERLYWDAKRGKPKAVTRMAKIGAWTDEAIARAEADYAATRPKKAVGREGAAAVVAILPLERNYPTRTRPAGPPAWQQESGSDYVVNVGLGQNVGALKPLTGFFVRPSFEPKGAKVGVITALSMGLVEAVPHDEVARERNVGQQRPAIELPTLTTQQPDLAVLR